MIPGELTTDQAQAMMLEGDSAVATFSEDQVEITLPRGTTIIVTPVVADEDERLVLRLTLR